MYVMRRRRIRNKTAVTTGLRASAAAIQNGFFFFFLYIFTKGIRCNYLWNRRRGGATRHSGNRRRALARYYLLASAGGRRTTHENRILTFYVRVRTVTPIHYCILLCARTCTYGVIGIGITRRTLVYHAAGVRVPNRIRKNRIAPLGFVYFLFFFFFRYSVLSFPSIRKR